jgi:hypothetical protein
MSALPMSPVSAAISLLLMATAAPAPSQAAMATFDISPWAAGGVDTSWGVSPYVVVLANELAGRDAAPDCSRPAQCTVELVYDAWQAEHRGLHGAPPVKDQTVAQLLGLPEPTADQISTVTAELKAAGLPIDSSDWR